MMIIEVTDDKLEKMSTCVEEILKKGGKLMQVLEELNSSNYHTKKHMGDYDDRDEGDYYMPRRSRKPDYNRYY